MVPFTFIQEVIQKHKHCFTDMGHCAGGGACSQAMPCKNCIIKFEKIKTVVNNEENIKKKAIANCIHQAGNVGWQELLNITGDKPIAPKKRCSPPPAASLCKRLRGSVKSSVVVGSDAIHPRQGSSSIPNEVVNENRTQMVDKMVLKPSSTFPPRPRPSSKVVDEVVATPSSTGPPTLRPSSQVVNDVVVHKLHEKRQVVLPADWPMPEGWFEEFLKAGGKMSPKELMEYWAMEELMEEEWVRDKDLLEKNMPNEIVSKVDDEMIQRVHTNVDDVVFNDYKNVEDTVNFCDVMVFHPALNWYRGRRGRYHNKGFSEIAPHIETDVKEQTHHVNTTDIAVSNNQMYKHFASKAQAALAGRNDWKNTRVNSRWEDMIDDLKKNANEKLEGRNYDKLHNISKMWDNIEKMAMKSWNDPIRHFACGKRWSTRPMTFVKAVEAEDI